MNDERNSMRHAWKWQATAPLILEGIARVEARLARIEDAMAGWSLS